MTLSPKQEGGNRRLYWSIINNLKPLKLLLEEEELDFITLNPIVKNLPVLKISKKPLNLRRSKTTITIKRLSQTLTRNIWSLVTLSQAWTTRMRLHLTIIENSRNRENNNRDRVGLRSIRTEEKPTTGRRVSKMNNHLNMEAVWILLMSTIISIKLKEHLMSTLQKEMMSLKSRLEQPRIQSRRQSISKS